MNFKNFKKFKKRPNKRFSYKNKKNRKVKYNLSTKMTTFGPGFRNLNVTKLVIGKFNNQVTLQTYTDILYDNPEMTTVINNFKYFKINNITLTFYPRNYNNDSNLTPLYFVVNYDGTTTQNLRLQDSVKIVPSFHTRAKYYKFGIPKVSTSSVLLNSWFPPAEFIRFDNILFQFHAPDNTSDWNFRIDINISCRGPTGVGNKQILRVKEVVEEGIQVKEEEEEKEKSLENIEFESCESFSEQIEKVDRETQTEGCDIDIKDFLDKNEKKRIKKDYNNEFHDDYHRFIKNFNINKENFEKLLDEYTRLNKELEILIRWNKRKPPKVVYMRHAVWLLINKTLLANETMLISNVYAENLKDFIRNNRYMTVFMSSNHFNDPLIYNGEEVINELTYYYEYLYGKDKKEELLKKLKEKEKNERFSEISSMSLAFSLMTKQP